MSYLDKYFGLKDKIVVVTGANGKLGREICKAYKRTGSKVVGLDLKVSKNTVEDVQYFNLDIREKNEVLKVFKKIIKRHGKIDILINNAGVATFDSFENRSESDFDLVTDVNLKGTFFCIQCYVNLFDQNKFKEGAIVNIASFYGVISPDFRVYTDCLRRSSEVYGATKAGIIQMTKYFGVHLAERNIRVNAVSPGGIYNPSNPQGADFIKNYSFRCPMQRMANDTEILGAIIYLSSEAASYTTGQNIIVDGGMSCW